MRKVKDENLEEKAKNGTFKCPICGGKVLINTGYCLHCKKKVDPPKGSEKPDKKDDKEKKKDDKKESYLNLLKTNRENEAAAKKELDEENIDVYEIIESVKISQSDCDILLEAGDKIKIIHK
jgi:DNA-directed RNA polymerase subunit RPC12/RpoP